MSTDSGTFMKGSYRVLLFLIVTAIVIVGGPAIVVYATYHGQGEIMFTEEMIMFVSLGVGVYVCTSVGYCLLYAVRHRWFYPSSAALYFFLAAAFSLVLPSLLMYASQSIWPSVFRGDSGFAFIAAPFMLVPFVVPVFVVFTSVFFWRSKSKNI